MLSSMEMDGIENTSPISSHNDRSDGMSWEFTFHMFYVKRFELLLVFVHGTK